MKTYYSSAGWEVEVTERSQALAATVVGAVVGGVAGYMFFTERGRVLRRQIEPALDDLAFELGRFRTTVAKAMGIATDGWRVLSETLSDSDSQVRYSQPHQTNPF